VRPRVAHVIQSLSRGGAARSLVATAEAAHDVDATIISLTPADPVALGQVAEAGLRVLDAPPRARALAALAEADVLHVHFWNSPELYDLLRSGLPPARVAVWSHVVGDSPPQVVTPELVAFADTFVAATAQTSRLPVLDAPPQVIVEAFDPRRVARVEPRPHDGFAVGYIGTVDPVKMHPRFAELVGAVEVPGARFVVCGSGGGFHALAEKGRRLGISERLDLRGYVEDVGGVLAELDVFGYPLAPGNYSASDLSLLEAMAAGVPPVVLPHGGTHALVRDGETGLVARDEAEWPRHVERLAADPALRARLGANARAEASRRTPTDAARAWGGVYAELLERPKRERAWPRHRDAGRFTGAAAFVESLGATAPEFATSLAARDDAEAAEAEELIAAAPPVVASAAGGGVLHYRRHYARDGYLSLWSGLVLEAAGKHVLAVAELKRALDLGCDAPRVRRYLARAADAIGAGEVAARA
jgi:glycosyltransferase involved in cell wall biosynthesis